MHRRTARWPSFPLRSPLRQCHRPSRPGRRSRRHRSEARRPWRCRRTRTGQRPARVRAKLQEPMFQRREGSASRRERCTPRPALKERTYSDPRAPKPKPHRRDLGIGIAGVSIIRVHMVVARKIHRNHVAARQRDCRRPGPVVIPAERALASESRDLFRGLNEGRGGGNVLRVPDCSFFIDATELGHALRAFARGDSSVGQATAAAPGSASPAKKRRGFSSSM
jgi:hypothetical protein